LKESRDSFSKENESLKKEFSNISTKFSKGLETLEHILFIQILYHNKSGLSFNIKKKK